MLPFLFLSHAALALFCLFTRVLAADLRSLLVRWAGGVGALSALWLFFARGSEATWGAFSLRPGPVSVVAAAIFCAWVILVAVDGGRGRWELGALVGAGSSALVLFASSDWIAPTLLFWVCLSAALWVTVWLRGAGGVALGLLALSDVLLIGGLTGHSLARESWAMPEVMRSWAGYALIASAVVRAGVLPGLGIWSLLGRAETAAIPLAVASAFVLVPTVSTGDEIFVALPLLLVGVATATWVIARRSGHLSPVAAWPVGLMLSIVWIEPRALGKAGVSAVLAASVVALWSWTGGRGQSERGLLLAVVPVTVGFGALVGGATASFERALDIGTVLGAAPWSAFAALLPAALALGVTLGAAVARRVEPERYQPAAVLATWALVLAGIVLGLSPSVQLGFSTGAGSAGRAPWLYLVALAAGVAAARFGPRQPVELGISPAAPEPGAIEASGLAATILLRVALLMGICGFGFALWFTYTGLRVGFL
ncbi:MAG: hypothetical protein M3N53_04885 [Actinomycetota bacterium]|nr:hypothetical protein [Actinomycetota bacterium]